ncbi:peptidylprolyl isomerase [Bdellovibrio sp. HCB337]|uniref:peptidylprolyl isomerase n=1 Tax=Bdellovibrio sp. HCB337 TaxID=3394358 RepID=UPI0039A5091F
MNLTAITSIFGVLLLSATVSFAQSKGSEVIATVGNKKITVDEFNKKYTDIKSQTLNPPTKPQFLEDLVRYEVGLQEAAKRNLERDPIVIERVQQETYKALLEKDLGPKVQKIQVSEAEMKAWYKNNPQVRTSHILIEYKPGATPEQVAEAKKRANEIYEEVKKSKRPFEELVKLYSDDPLSKQAGGDVGWQSRVTLVPSYYEAAVSGKVGDIKGLVETPFGFHIIKITGRNPYDAADKRQIRSAVYDEKRKQAFNEYFEKLKKNYPIKTNPSLIK